MSKIHEAAAELRTVPFHLARDAAAQFANLAIDEIESLWARIARLEALAETDGTYFADRQVSDG